MRNFKYPIFMHSLRYSPFHAISNGIFEFISEFARGICQVPNSCGFNTFLIYKIFSFKILDRCLTLCVRTKFPRFFSSWRSGWHANDALIKIRRNTVANGKSEREMQNSRASAIYILRYAEKLFKLEERELQRGQ